MTQQPAAHFGSALFQLQSCLQDPQNSGQCPNHKPRWDECIIWVSFGPEELGPADVRWVVGGWLVPLAPFLLFSLFRTLLALFLISVVSCSRSSLVSG